MSTISLHPQKGFRDLYPYLKIQQEYIFEKLKMTAKAFGFQFYDGPILEDIEIYLEKTSRELIDRQTFQVRDKNEKTLVLRPEMTPSLARMVAAKAHLLTFPLRLFNIGLRFRYEAPQKGREREFYQADFDILGADSIVADAEILATAITIFTSFGATEKDFSVHVNSRSFVENTLSRYGIDEIHMKSLFSLIDRKDKISSDEFSKELHTLVSTEAFPHIEQFLHDPAEAMRDPYFSQLFSLLKQYGMDQFVTIDTTIVRGLDYYTGLVFEVKDKGSLRRSILGGGRYDNLVSQYNEKLHIPGVGFATSDVVLLAFLQDKGFLSSLNPVSTTVLVTVFDESLLADAIQTTTNLRKAGISTELFPDANKKIDKQLKYADKNHIPYVVIIGPEEAQHQKVIVKSLEKHTQITVDNTKDAILKALQIN